ncbi:diacylglycerol/lipid kinase family protein [Neobacillus dielmonensis]|uniref:diacylglycerol/lipid kinase family protein n=1 Tax=Neobacillus dielmonensis TaxID=1347369 RepID=UPI0005A86B9C|nr:diacylglycerol kinase family protein [Neobacillus dielmonensis]
MKPIYFIINPKAKNGKCFSVWQKIEVRLKLEGISYMAFFTEYPGHAKTLAGLVAAAPDGIEKVVVAVGGDGTIHEVVNGIVNFKHIILGFIPGGSGNDFSRGFQIPKEPEDALRVLLRLIKGKPALIDHGKITMPDHTEHSFINNMGAGFDALIAYEANHSKIKAWLNKLSLGRLVYVYFLIRELFTYKTSQIHLFIDGKEHKFESTWFVTVSNQAFYGGGMKIAPLAEPDDGLLDITVAHKLTRWKLLLVFISVFWGKHVHFKEVKTFRGKQITIQSNVALFVHGDGEHIGYTPLTIEIEQKGLQVLTRRKKNAEITMIKEEANDSC